MENKALDRARGQRKWECFFFFFYLLNHDSSCQLSIGQKVRDERKWGKREMGEGKQQNCYLDFKQRFKPH